MQFMTSMMTHWQASDQHNSLTANFHRPHSDVDQYESVTTQWQTVVFSTHWQKLFIDNQLTDITWLLANKQKNKKNLWTVADTVQEKEWLIITLIISLWHKTFMLWLPIFCSCNFRNEYKTVLHLFCFTRMVCATSKILGQTIYIPVSSLGKYKENNFSLLGSNQTHNQRKPVLGVSDQERPKQPVQLKRLIILKICMELVGLLYFPESESQRCWSDCPNLPAQLSFCF